VQARLKADEEIIRLLTIRQDESIAPKRPQVLSTIHFLNLNRY
jgi:hypothetical protein